MLCDERCRWQRLKLSCLQADYRQYWYDRRRGQKPMPASVFWKWHSRPVWQIWGAA